MEMQATGVGWTFATTLAVPQDIRWGRTHKGYGRDPALVSRLGAALVEGLQGRSRTDCTVLGCAKHFVGDGATSWGTVRRNEAARWWDGWGENWKIDQGDAQISEAELRSVHLPPYAAAMPSAVRSM